MTRIIIIPGTSADGVYQASGFGKVLRQDVADDSEFVKRVTWDPSHWINLAVTDVKEGKIGTSKEFFSEFIKRTNAFSDSLNRGKGEL